jgi:hypothetical protein
MIRPRANKRGVVAVALGVLLACNCFGLVLYEFVLYRASFHSDAAVKSIYAAHVVATGSLFPRDWAYANGDVMVFFGHLFIIPLLAFFPNGFALHAVSGTAMAALLLLTTWWLLALLGVARSVRLLGLALFASGISSYFAENWYGQVSYGPVTILLFLHLGLALLAAVRAARHAASGLLGIGLAALALVSFASNPLRALVTYTLPMAVFSLSIGMRGKWLDTRRWLAWARGMRSAALFYAAGAIVGIGAHALILGRAVSIAAGGKQAIGPIETVGAHASLLLRSILFLFGIDSGAGHSVAGPMGLVLLLHVALLVAIVVAVASLQRQPADRNAGAVATAAAASLLVAAFLYLFTNLAEDVSSSRYFVPAFSLGLVALLLAVDRHRGRAGAWTFAAAATIAGIALSSYPLTLALAYRSTRAAGDTLAFARNPSDPLVAFLERNDLHDGYASYWHAHVNTVLSSGRLRIRPVIYAGLPRGMYQLSAPSWYGPSAAHGPKFFLLTRSELSKVDLEALQRIAGPPQRTLEFGDYVVLVYAQLPDPWLGWDPGVQAPAELHFDRHTPHAIGRYVEAAASAGWLEAPAGSSGALVFGPYIALARGRYVAEFEVRSCGGSHATATLDVSSSAGAPRVFGTAKVIAPDGWSFVPLGFELASSIDGIELRVIASGDGCLAARSVRLRRGGDDTG